MTEINKMATGQISIHALLAESDADIAAILTEINNFYPRSPCGERLISTKKGQVLSLFLSTLSLRRATEYWVGGYGTAYNFYPRSPCGERPGGKIHDPGKILISIHALLAESDLTQIGIMSGSI